MSTPLLRLLAFLLLAANLVFAAPPNIVNAPVAQNITSNSAIIYWSTDAPTAQNSVNFGVTDGLGTIIANDSNVTDHFVSIGQLSPNTPYYFNVTSCFDPNNCTTRGPNTFTTLAEQVPTMPAPVIHNASINASPSYTSASISWTTDIPSNTAIFYGISAAILNSTNSVPDNVTAHAIPISGLASNTTYFYIVQSCNAANCTNSTEKTFLTLVPVPSPSPSPSPSPIPSPSPSPSATAIPASTPTPSPTFQMTTGYSNCVDSDGGKDYFKRGTVYATNEVGDDVCETDSILKENYCNDERTLAGAIRYTCAYGCRDGRCLTELESGTIQKAAGNNTNASRVTAEKKLGFKTKVVADFGTDASMFVLSQDVGNDFEGEMKLVFPFAFKDYADGKVAFSPKPVLTKNDGNGKIEAIWENFNIVNGLAEIQITVSGNYAESILSAFSVPILTAATPLSLKTDANMTIPSPTSNGNFSDNTAGLTGMGTLQQAAGDTGWYTAAIQIVLLLVGIFAVGHFERDVTQLNTEHTSSILEELDVAAINVKKPK
ncbi:MAG: hypothetical protein V1835_05925 [Candidatus Micrarchaeota archaeon]